MALFKVLRGNEANLFKENEDGTPNVPLKDGNAYFTQDTHNFYIDHQNEDGTIERGLSGAGLNTAEHGTIFNDLKGNWVDGAYSAAMGKNTQVGLKAYHIISIDITNKKIYLSASEDIVTPIISTTNNLDTNFITPEYKADDEFSLIIKSSAGRSHYHFVSKIKSIQNNMIEYTTDLPFNNVVADHVKSNVFFVPSKPQIGIVSMSMGSFGEGEDTITAGENAHAEGLSTIAAGNYGHAEGRNTKAAYAAHSEGMSTKASHNYSHAEGYSTLASGLASHSEGRGTQATNEYAHAEGVDTIASGKYSHAEGQKSQANGEVAHAEGKENYADGNYSHAEGWQTKASGQGSHVEGNGTKTGKYDQNDKYIAGTGLYAHAEGNFARASGQHAHAEGSYTTASGDDSHSEGNGNIASGLASHAEGIGTFAHGSYSHAEGQGTYIETSGTAAHVEGYGTYATKYAAHAEGTGTHADGNYSHAEGHQTHAEGAQSHSEGSGTYATQSAAHAEGLNSRADGVGAHGEGGNTKAIGNYSHSEGYSSQAYNTAAHAEGRNTYAYAEYSHAEGESTKAGSKGFRIYDKINNADYTTSFIVHNTNNLIKGNTVSIQLDNFYPNCGKILDIKASQTTTDAYEVVINTIINEDFDATITDTKKDKNVLRLLDNPNAGDVYLGISTHTEGEATQAFTRAGHAEGKKTKVIGDAGHAEGELTIASYAAHAEGTSTQALGFNSHAEGSNTTATGDNSHTEGIGTQATATNAHAEGAYTEAKAPQAHAEGHHAKAKGFASHAEGSGSEAREDNSHAEGNYTIAEGGASHAEGDATKTYGFASHAEGSNTIATGAYQHVQGRYNIEDKIDKYVHIVGNGSSETYRRNIHTLDWDGVAWFAQDIKVGGTDQNDSRAKSLAKQEDLDKVPGLKAGAGEIFNNYNANIALGGYSHAEGSYTQATSMTSHAEGNGSKAFGEHSHAEGNYSTAEGNVSHAEGDVTYAEGFASHAEGMHTQATEDGAHAEGDYSAAKGHASHAEGYVTRAEGYASHTEGNHTVATAPYQHVQGKYNDFTDIHNYAHIVGGGDSETSRKNIHTIDWNGDATFAGFIDAQGIKLPTTTITLYPSDCIGTFGKYKCWFLGPQITDTTIDTDIYISLYTLRIPDEEQFEEYLIMKEQYENAQIVAIDGAGHYKLVVTGEMPTVPIKIEIKSSLVSRVEV